MTPPPTADPRDGLRHLLTEEPSELTFRAVCSLLDAWPRPDHDEALAAAERSMAAWPDSVRVAPPQWLRALHAGREMPPWRLARTVRNYDDSLGDGPVPLRLLGERPEWSFVRRVELRGEGDDDLRWLLDTQALWPQLHSIKASFARGDAATARLLSSSPLLPRLRTLSLDCRETDFPVTSLVAARRLDRLGLRAHPEEVRALLERSRFPALRTLKVARPVASAGSDPETAARLGTAPGIERLKTVELWSWDARETAALLASPALRRMREVILRREACAAPSGPETADALSGRPFLATLTRLSITGYPLGDGGVIRLADALRHTRLQRLTLAGVAAGDEAVMALAACTGLRRLEALDLSGNRVGLLGASSLAGSPFLESLSEVDLGGGEEAQPVGDVGVIVLAGAPSLAGLRRLSLRNAGLTPRAAAALAASRPLRGLRALTLSHNRLGADGVSRLTSGTWDALRSLDLTRGGLDDRAAILLAGCPSLGGLWRLDMRGNTISSEGLDSLKSLPSLVELHADEPATPRSRCSHPST